MESAGSSEKRCAKSLSVPQLLPVIDVREGIVVRGVAGRRDSYRPLSSSLAGSADPVDVAKGLQDRVGHNWLYVADLDAIERDVPDWKTLSRLAAAGCQTIVDAGLRHSTRAIRLVGVGVAGVIAALETLPGLEPLAGIIDAIGAEKTLFSLDLKHGELLGNSLAWGSTDPLAIARQAASAGVQAMIVLDLAGVGIGGGVATVKLCERLRQHHSQLTLVTGGGVRHADDVRQLLSQGVDSVLVASALHDGAIDSAAAASFC